MNACTGYSVRARSENPLIRKENSEVLNYGNELTIEAGKDDVLEIAVGVFFQTHIGATRSWTRKKGGAISTQGRVHCRAQPNVPVPACLEMLGLEHALILDTPLPKGSCGNYPNTNNRVGCG